MTSNAEESLATLIRWEKLPQPEREYRFAPPRKWRFDFAWVWEPLPRAEFGGTPEPGLAVEVEGGSWVGGHGGVRFEQDAEKYNEAGLLGWVVLRVTPKMIEDGRAIALLKRALA